MARPEDSGVKSSIKKNPLGPETAMRAQLFHGRLDWKMIHLREHIRRLQREEEKRLGAHFDPERTPLLPDNFLSERALDNAKVARQNRYLMLEEIDALWCDLVAGFERAVIYGDAEWFDRQAKAIRSRDTRTATDAARDQFEAAIMGHLAASALLLRGEEDSTPTLTRKRTRKGWEWVLRPTGDTPDQIIHLFLFLFPIKPYLSASGEWSSQPKGATRFRMLVAPGVEVQFASRARAREEITRLAALGCYELERKRKATPKLKRK